MEPGMTKSLVMAAWVLAGMAAGVGCGSGEAGPAKAEPKPPEEASKVDAEHTREEAAMDPKDPNWKISKSEDEWRVILTPRQFYVTREAGTEPAFRNEYWDNKKPGTYKCVACGLPLFDSETKFESGTGWPSFYKPIEERFVAEKADDSLGIRRTEVLCARCDSHLGHVFSDGPEPTGLRYCINSAALTFQSREEAPKDEER